MITSQEFTPFAWTATPLERRIIQTTQRWPFHHQSGFALARSHLDGKTKPLFVQDIIKQDEPSSQSSDNFPLFLSLIYYSETIFWMTSHIFFLNLEFVSKGVVSLLFQNDCWLMFDFEFELEVGIDFCKGEEELGSEKREKSLRHIYYFHDAFSASLSFFHFIPIALAISVVLNPGFSATTSARFALEKSKKGLDFLRPPASPLAFAWSCFWVIDLRESWCGIVRKEKVMKTSAFSF